MMILVICLSLSVVDDVSCYLFFLYRGMMLLEGEQRPFHHC